jgi:transcription initiation factor TFIID subunit 5
MAKLQRRTLEEMDIEANVKQKVLEYLVKKGYNRTEQMLRQESAHLDKDGRPIHNRVEELGNIKYARGFEMLSNWIDQNLDIYKVSCIHLPVVMLPSCFADIFESLSLGDCSGQCSFTHIWSS